MLGISLGIILVPLVWVIRVGSLLSCLAMTLFSTSMEDRYYRLLLIDGRKIKFNPGGKIVLGLICIKISRKTKQAFQLPQSKPML